MGIFSKKSCSVTHNYMWVHNTMLSFRKRLLSQSIENLWTDGKKDGRKEGRMDGHNLFYRTLSAEAGGPKNISNWKKHMKGNIRIKEYNQKDVFIR